MTRGRRAAEATVAAMLETWVQPGASRDRITGLREGAVKIAVVAPAEKGRANKAVAALLARKFGVPVSAVVLERGGAARRKTFRLEGVGAAQIREWLSSLESDREN